MDDSTLSVEVEMASNVGSSTFSIPFIDQMAGRGLNSLFRSVLFCSIAFNPMLSYPLFLSILLYHICSAPVCLLLFYPTLLDELFFSILF
jgi:hypothetical protein